MTKVLSSIKLPVATQANVESAYSGAGLIYYDSTSAAIRVHDGTSWAGLAGSSDMPIGSIQPWLGATTPSGWLVCTGQAVSRTTYSALYAIIGENYGPGNGTTTFNVPDIQGRQVTGAPSTGYQISTETNIGGGNDAWFTNAHIGSYGLHTHSLTYTAFTEPEHNYGHTHVVTVTDGTSTYSAHTFSATANAGQSHSHTASFAAGTATTGTATGQLVGGPTHGHTSGTVSTETHQHSVTSSSWSAHAAHRHSPVFSLSTSGNTTSASIANHNHTATPSSDGSHTHTNHSYKTHMTHYIIKAV